MIESITRAGPGDSTTWGDPTGHPNDPRTDDPPEIVTTLHTQLEEIESELRSARRALDRGDYATTCAAVQKIREVAAWL